MNKESLSIIKSTPSLEDIQIDIDQNHFINIKETILKTFKKLRMNPDNLCVFYQRNENGTSILAIKVEKGNDDDITKYMFNGSTVNYYNDRISCDVYLHAEAPAAKKSVNIAGEISREIVHFFEELETELLIKGLKNSAFSVKIPLQEKKQKQEEKGIRRLIKKHFKNID